MSSDSVGQRLRSARKLAGLTQVQLGMRAHVSTSLVTKVEAGSVPASAAMVAGCAQGLGIAAADLYGTRESAEPVAASPAAGIPELRSALDAYDDPRPTGEPLGLAEARRRVREAGDRASALRYAAAGRDLPGLLRHLYVLSDTSPAARSVLHDAYRLAATVAGRYGHSDLAAVASERHIALAPLTDDPLRVAISAFHRSSAHLNHGTFDAGLRLLERAYDDVVADSDTARAVQAQLLLRAAVLAARSGDLSRGDEYLSEARELAHRYRLPPFPYYNVDVSTLNMEVHWCALPVEVYDSAESIRRAELTPIQHGNRPERVAHHHFDQARAWLLHGNRDRVL
ncbi:MAG: helix-turn-helix domain-containing protein, partial [Sciscionella sp.]